MERVTMAHLRGNNLACPFFVPLEVVHDGSWPHPARLPLGAGWRGNCHASGDELPASEAHLRDFCNLGYAAACPYLPPHREWDAIRFCIAHESRNQVIVSFVCELAHAPVEFGTLTYDLSANVWVDAKRDARVVRLANSYLQTYRVRRVNAA
jgi:hypothetical protein